MRDHLPGILRHFDTGLSNGSVEGSNAQIQAAKARAKGYRTVVIGREFSSVLHQTLTPNFLNAFLTAASPGVFSLVAGTCLKV